VGRGKTSAAEDEEGNLRAQKGRITKEKIKPKPPQTQPQKKYTESKGGGPLTIGK